MDVWIIIGEFLLWCDKALIFRNIFHIRNVDYLIILFHLDTFSFRTKVGFMESWYISLHPVRWHSPKSRCSHFSSQICKSGLVDWRTGFGETRNLSLIVTRFDFVWIFVWIFAFLFSIYHYFIFRKIVDDWTALTPPTKLSTFNGAGFKKNCNPCSGSSSSRDGLSQPLVKSGTISH